MKKYLLAAVLLVSSLGLTAQSLPSKTEIIDKMRLVNDFWIAQNPVPGNNQWARAAYFTGNVDFYKQFPKESYLDYSLLWGNNNNWSLNGGTGTRNADNQTCGQTYIDLFNLDDAQQFIKISAISQSIENMVNSTKSDDWWWIDALYMAMPVFTRLGVLRSNNAYFNRMYDLYYDTKIRRGLFNPTTGLWYRDASFKPPFSTKNGKESYWSRGNGWVIAAHIRVLQLLPENDIHRDEYIQTFQQMAEAIKNRQRSDGFWGVSLDDPNEFPGPETSGTAFFTYSLAWGINNHLLDSATYMPIVEKAWNGLISIAVQPNGALGYVQGVGSNPASAQPVTVNSTADFGVGAFLLAGTEVVKLANGEMPVPTNFYVKNITAVNQNIVKIQFSKSVDFSIASKPENFQIMEGIVINKIEKGENDSTVLLHVSDLIPGKYTMQTNNIVSNTGLALESQDSISFIYTGMVAITASEYENGTSNTPDKTMDFDLGTRWSSYGNNQWIMYDLGEVKTILSVDLAFYNGNIRRGLFSINFSKDGLNFTEVYNGSSSGTTVNPENYDFADQDARFVKIIGYGNTQSLWNSITETRINFDNKISDISELTTGKFNIYPNPTNSNFINIDMEDIKGLDELIITNINGQVIFQKEISMPAIEINIGESFEKGIYLIKLKKRNLAGKLIIE